MLALLLLLLHAWLYASPHACCVSAGTSGHHACRHGQCTHISTGCCCASHACELLRTNISQAGSRERCQRSWMDALQLLLMMIVMMMMLMRMMMQLHAKLAAAAGAGHPATTGCNSSSSPGLRPVLAGHSRIRVRTPARSSIGAAPPVVWLLHASLLLLLVVVELQCCHAL